MALVLLAYWTVSFRTFKDRWWVGGLNVMILEHIAELIIPLDECDEDMTNKQRQNGEAALRQTRPKSYSHLAVGSNPGKIKWRDLLEWPLRENGIYDS